MTKEKVLNLYKLRICLVRIQFVPQLVLWVEYLGEPEIRNAIFEATEQVINEGKYVTYDIGGNAKTSQMADAIAQLAKKILAK